MSTEHNWPEDFSHENGNYNNDCYMCKTVFIGHKRRHVCRVCATPKSIRDQLAHLQSQLDECRKELTARLAQVERERDALTAALVDCHAYLMQQLKAKSLNDSAKDGTQKLSRMVSEVLDAARAAVAALSR
jgi:cell division protein ZapA (FtsZ GTPase activity inhibitor)